MKLRLLSSNTTDPFFNVALDQTLLEISSRKKDMATIRWWTNSPAVVVGRLQELTTEVDVHYCQEQNIPIIRRISGGGTVFHDFGNLNTTFIFPISNLPAKDIQQASHYFTQIQSEVLDQMGYDSIEIEGGTNIFYKGNKISGSAGHLTRGWFLHHATLLFDSDLKKLNRVLLARNSYPDDPKASRYFPTTNLPEFEHDRWKRQLIDRLGQDMEIESEEREITQKEIDKTEELVEIMYSDPAWIYDRQRKFISFS